MKTVEELNAIKDEVENVTSKLAGLTDKELKQVKGGSMPNVPGLDFLSTRSGTITKAIDVNIEDWNPMSSNNTLNPSKAEGADD